MTKPYTEPIYDDVEPKTWQQAVYKVRREMPNDLPTKILQETVRRYGYLRDRVDPNRSGFPVGCDNPPKMSALKAARLKAGLTQMKVATLSGVSLTRIQQLENYPDSEPGFDVARSLAIALRSHASALFPSLADKVKKMVEQTKKK
jgi:DNA-binding XRE family transcriptional regulator